MRHLSAKPPSLRRLTIHCPDTASRDTVNPNPLVPALFGGEAPCSRPASCAVAALLYECVSVRMLVFMCT